MGIPAVPLTLEGAAVLHQMFRFRWPQWRATPGGEQAAILAEAAAALQDIVSSRDGESALYSLLGHKGDLMFVHFRPGFDTLAKAELQLARTRFSDYLEPTTSYLSVIELSLYESSVQVYTSLASQNIEPGTVAWNAEIEATLERQRKAMEPRLWPDIPPGRYICFYPMNRKRGELKNWYSLPLDDRQRMMHEHGLTGRKYAGRVKQIITGSTGLDDWEWAVDLFADDPLQFKKVVYEMRFDEASAIYADFGPFYVGLLLPVADLAQWLNGKAD